MVKVTNHLRDTDHPVPLETTYVVKEWVYLSATYQLIQKPNGLLFIPLVNLSTKRPADISGNSTDIEVRNITVQQRALTFE